jgi:hypothetical protein
LEIAKKIDQQRLKLDAVAVMRRSRETQNTGGIA